MNQLIIYPKRCKLITTAFLLFTVIGCSNDPEQKDSSTQFAQTASVDDNSEQDPYYLLQFAFEGRPEIHDFKPQLHAVLDRYGMKINRDNLLMVGKVLMLHSNNSEAGVTELEILKHIYKKGSPRLSFVEQAKISASIVELNK